jgi:glycerophosphoryl diester phosphodiesterase
MAAGSRIVAPAEARQAPRAPRPGGARPLVLGHRGASGDAPENTMAAFRLAMEQGADGFELDVWRCATGELVVVHDQDGRRVAASPLSVPDSPWRDLRALDVGAWRGPRFAGARVPLLEEVLEALPGAVVNVELKTRGRGEGGEALARTAAEVIRAARADERVVVSSFDWRLLRAFRRAAPGLPVGLLFDGTGAWRLRLALGIPLLSPAAVHPDRALVTPGRVAAWSARGLAVNVWTVDAPEEVRRLAALGVAALITNWPARAVAALRAT